MNDVKLISVTPDAEKHIAYCARVSNPQNQENEKFSGLLKYCIKHQHWSIFEQAFMTLELNTSRGIAAQVLRHRSFTYQEFSQRYADVNWLDAGIPVPELRRQDEKNRQNSIDDIDPKQTKFLNQRIEKYFNEGMDLYNELLREGIAKECARLRPPPCCAHQTLHDGFLSAHGFIILICALPTAHRRSIWILLMTPSVSLKNSSLLLQKHWSGKNV